MEDTARSTDVFISRKSADKAMATELYRFLTAQGLKVFESDETLPKLGSSDYRKAIDHALDECKHMVVVGSSVENIASSWVEAEWGFYIGEKRAGRKKGNILTVITNNLEIKDLPASLRYYEVIFYDKANFDKIAAYLGKNYEDPKYKPPRKPFYKTKWFLPAASLLCLLIAGGYFTWQWYQPFNATIFLKPQANLQLHSSYPHFEGGELTIVMDNNVQKKTVPADGEVILKQLPNSFRDTKVVATLKSDYWKLEKDTIELSSTTTLSMVPDQSLATIFGNIKDVSGNSVSNCQITIDDNDTTITSNENGYFKVVMPWRLQKPQYILHVTKEGFNETKTTYFPKSGSIDIQLK